MHSTHLRRKHIHGALLGAAVGDALGHARQGLKRRTALQIYGRPPLTYRMLAGRGIYTSDTQLMLMTAQALLNSRTDLGSFRRAFRCRLSWYALSLPHGCGWATYRAALRSWLVRFRLPSGVNSSDNGPGASAVFTALAIHGTGHRLPKWIDETAQLTRRNPLAQDGCVVLAVLADEAATIKQAQFDASHTLDKAIEASTCEEIKSKLKQLKPFLEQSRSPSAVARHFGWEHGIDRAMVPTTVMAAYCWLRYPRDYRRAVQSAICLGGDSSSMGAIVGGLTGAHLGVDAVPKSLVQRLGGTPHDPDWIKALADRFSHWPHGLDDLHMAAAQTSDPPLQFLRNLFTIPVLAVNRALRIIRGCCASSRPNRARR